jgi:radical SAM protein with 4Fe4S-binding SPASM domain
LNAKKRLANRRDIEFITQGISDTSGTLSFNSDGDSASAANSEEACTIEVTTLDVTVKEKVTFIKMDLEGWEIKALEGCKQHITEDHPKLAISVYHSAFDFWRVPEYILSIRQDYDIYLRHYTEGWSETVMFFMPKIETPLNKIGGRYYWDHFIKQKDIPLSLFDYSIIRNYEEQVNLFKKYVCIVNIETSTYCNRVCSYCPVSTDEGRKKQLNIKNEVFEKIISELQQISYKSTICFNLYNEPLADKYLYQRLTYARKALPNAFFLFNSNGDYLNKDKLNRLSDTGLNAIFVTLHPSPKKSYELNDRIKCFHKLFKKLGVTDYIIDESAKDGNIESNVDWRGMRLRVMANDWAKYGNSRAGTVDFLNTSENRTTPCVRPLREFTISHDGNVFPCCQFYPETSEKYVVGNVELKSIFEIYSSNTLAMWRKDLFTFGEKKTPCDSCRDEDFSDISSAAIREKIIM